MSRRFQGLVVQSARSIFGLKSSRMVGFQALRCRGNVYSSSVDWLLGTQQNQSAPGITDSQCGQDVLVVRILSTQYVALAGPACSCSLQRRPAT
jgi:hypothetical protein